MEIFYVHQLITDKIRVLRAQNREEEIIELVSAFSQAQNLVEKVIPFLPKAMDKEDYILVQNLKMKSREELLYKIMLPYLSVPTKKRNAFCLFLN